MAVFETISNTDANFLNLHIDKATKTRGDKKKQKNNQWKLLWTFMLVYVLLLLIIDKNFQAEFESEGLRSQKISYYDNKKTVDLLLNVSCQLLDLLIMLKSF